MATLASNVLTLADWAKRLDQDGKVPTIVELLSQTNPILQDALWIEANGATSHRISVRTGYPTATWRKINAGVPKSKSTTATIDETIGMLEAWSDVDQDLAELGGNVKEFRLSESIAFIEAMNQTMASTLFYGDATINPERFTGLAPRFNLSTAGNGQNVIKGGGTGSDNTSVWLVVWGQNAVTGIFPKGSKAGLKHEDLGLDTVNDPDGNPYRAYRDHYQWKAGIAIKDWRYVVRIANIDVSNLVAKTSAADLAELMIKATYRIPQMSMGKAVFYASRTVVEMLHIQARDDGNNQLRTGNDTFGNPVTAMNGIPIRAVDAILGTEATIN